MICPTEETIGAWLEGAVAGEDRRSLTEHFAACEGCRQVVALSAAAEPLRSVSLRYLGWSAAAAGILVAVFFLARMEGDRDRREVADRPPAGEDRVAEEPSPRTEAAVTPKTGEPSETRIAEKRPDEPPSTPEASPKVPEVSPDAVGARPEEPKKEEAPIAEAPPQGDREGPGETRAEAPADAFRATAILNASAGVRVGSEPVGEMHWLRHDESLVAREGGGFTVDGRLAVAMEADSELRIRLPRAQDVYEMAFVRGAAMIQSEAEPVALRVIRGSSSLELKDVQGIVAVDATGERLRMQIMDGYAVWNGQDIEEGKEVVEETAGRGHVERAARKLLESRKDQWERLRPEFMTLFETTFDEGPDEVFFIYEVPVGKVVATEEGRFVLASAGPQPEWRLTAELSPTREVIVRPRTVLRLRYRAPGAEVEIVLDGYSAKVPGSATWATVEIPLSAFQNEGVPLVTGDRIGSFSFSVSGRSAALELDRVALVQRKSVQ